MKLSRILLLGAAAFALAGCSEDKIDAPELGPVSGLRYVNIVPDTIGQDLRMVDVTWHAMLGVGFRSAYPNQGYQAVPAGQHRFKIFFSPQTATGVPRNENLVQITFKDTVATLAEGTNYTALHFGTARNGSNEFLLIEDDYSAATPGDDEISFRVVHAVAGTGNVDVYVRDTSTSPLPATPTFGDVAYGTVSDYSIQSTGPMQVVVTAAGDPTTVISSLTVTDGVPADNVSSGAAGDKAGGSVFTLFLAPRSTAGSLATSFTTPGILFATDRRPPIIP